MYHQKFFLSKLIKLLKKKKVFRVAIYGTGDNAVFLRENLKLFTIVCFLDGKKSDGNFFDVPITSLERLKEFNIDSIIIAAEYKNEKIIFDRIQEFCFDNNIYVIGMHMGDIVKALSYKMVGHDENEYLSQNRLYAEIEAHEIISFDIFDTLLMRKTLFPMDVFDLVGNSIKEHAGVESFKSNRIWAERKLLHQGRNVTFEDIYVELKDMLDISDEMIHKIASKEIEIERKVIISREAIKEAFFHALDLHKKVYLISDMYLEKQVLRKILSDNGIEGYVDIYVSCEYDLTKETGLFSIFKKSVKGNSYLHIGNDSICDGLAATSNGIDSFIIPSSYDVLKKSKWKDICFYLSGINNRNMVGLAISKAFNSPFSFDRKGTVEIDSLEAYTQCFLAPIFSAFMIWFVHKILAGQYRKVLFAARDGYFIKRMYDWYKENVDSNLPDSVYFYTSRKACIGMGIYDKSDIEHHKNCYEKNVLMEIFGLNEDEFNSDEAWIDYSKQRRNNYAKYMEKLNFSFEEKCCFFDFISGGTSQYYLSQFFSDLHGLYFMYVLPRKNAMQHVPRISSFDQYFGYGKYTIDTTDYKHLLIELVASSPEGSVKDFDINGNPVFSIDQRSTAHLDAMEDMQNVIFNFFKQYASNLYIDSEHIDNSIAKRLLDYRFECHRNGNMFNFSFYEDLFGKKWNISDMT